MDANGSPIVMGGTDMTNPWWPLIYLRAFDENRTGSGCASEVSAASLAAMRDQVNGVLSAVNGNASMAQNQAILTSVNNIGTLLQQGNFQISEKICECCCKLNTAICDLKTTTQFGFQGVSNDICNLGKDLAMQSERSTQSILDALTAGRLEAKDAIIAEQAQKLQEATTKEIVTNQTAALHEQIGTLTTLVTQLCASKGQGNS